MFKFCVYTIASLLLSACAFCGTHDGQVFTLYRNSAADENIRIHVATFDISDKEENNRDNCEQAQLLFQNQHSVRAQFWCEKGRFKK